MGIETLPYPDPHTPAEGYTGISAGDVIRFSPLDRYGGPSDVEDCIVRDIECEPRDFTTGEAFPHPCHRLHVTVLAPPAMTAPVRTIGDVQVKVESTLIVDARDVFVRTDPRDASTLVKYVDSLSN